MSLKKIQIFIETNAIAIGVICLGFALLAIVIFTLFKPIKTVENSKDIRNYNK